MRLLCMKSLLSTPLASPSALHGTRADASEKPEKTSLALGTNVSDVVKRPLDTLPSRLAGSHGLGGKSQSFAGQRLLQSLGWHAVLVGYQAISAGLQHPFD